MLTRKSILTSSLLALSATVTLCLSLSSVCFADTAAEPVGKVLSVKQSGYATRLQQSVKHTIKVGDILYAGDQIDVKAGNVVQIALDADRNNVIHIPGDSLVQLNKDRAIGLELGRGQVFALLDKLEPGTKFRVVTPTAISTVRGTYFGVRMIGTATETSVYRGAVGVSGRLANGKALGASVPVNAGHKTVVTHTGTQPQEPKRMTAVEFDQINGVIRSLDNLKKPLDYETIDPAKPSDKKAPASGSDADINKSTKDKDLNEDANSGGKVVF